MLFGQRERKRLQYSNRIFKARIFLSISISQMQDKKHVIRFFARYLA